MQYSFALKLLKNNRKKTLLSDKSPVAVRRSRVYDK